MQEMRKAFFASGLSAKRVDELSNMIGVMIDPTWKHYRDDPFFPCKDNVAPHWHFVFVFCVNCLQIWCNDRCPEWSEDDPRMVRGWSGTIQDDPRMIPVGHQNPNQLEKETNNLIQTTPTYISFVLFCSHWLESDIATHRRSRPCVSIWSGEGCVDAVYEFGQG